MTLGIGIAISAAKHANAGESKRPAKVEHGLNMDFRRPHMRQGLKIQILK